MQRAPVAGEVVAVKHRPGLFRPPTLDAASEDNERNSVLIRTPEGVDVVAVQIAGLIARRIVCDVKAGDKLALGETYGLIRFGSRLDTYLPEGASVLSRSVSARSAARPCWRSCRDETARQSRPGRRPAHPAERDDGAGDLRSACPRSSSPSTSRPTEAMALLGAAAILDGIDGRIARAAQRARRRWARRSTRSPTR